MPDIYTEDISSGNPQNNPLAGSDLEIQARQAASQRQQALEQPARQTPITDALEIPEEGTGIPGLTNEDLFPGMNDPIMKGMSSSQTLGSQPIFVASGQYLPLNILNKKQLALDQAAQKRFERQMKFDPGAAAKLNNPRYQSELDNSYAEMTNKYIKEAQALYGKDWDVALNSQSTDLGRRFATEKRNLNTLAEQSNVIFDKVALVNAAKETGGPTLFSPETQKLANEVQFRLGEMANGNLTDITAITDQLNGSYDLDTFLAENKVVTSMKADISASIEDNGGYLTEQQVETYRQAIADFAESETATPAGRYHGDDIITRKDIEDRLNSLLRTKITKSAKMKPQAPAHVEKAKTQEERVRDRVEVITASASDPKSPLAQQTVNNLRGKQYAGGTVTSSGYVTPESYTPYQSSASSFSDYYFQNVGKKEGGVFGFFQDNTFDINAKDQLISSMKNAGLEEEAKKIKSVRISNEDTGEIEIVGTSGKKDVFNLSTEEGVTEFENWMIEKGGLDPNYKDKTTVKVDYYDKNNKSEESEYLDITTPEYWAAMNEFLNQDVGEANKVAMPDINKARGLTGKNEEIKSETQAPTQQQQSAPQQQQAAPQAAKKYNTVEEAVSEMVDYESTKGVVQGGKAVGHDNFGFNLKDANGKRIVVKNKEEAIAKFKEIYGDRIKDYKNPVERAKASDFMFNTGTDPKIYELHNYSLENGVDMGISAEERRALKLAAKNNNGKYPSSITYKDANGKTIVVENPEEKISKLYNKYISSLSDQDRIDNLDNARSWYYKNIDGGKNYEITHKGRLDLYGGRSESAFANYQKTQEYKDRVAKIKKQYGDKATDESIAAYIRKTW